ncbi:MAG: hypothetical protein HXY22_12865 [Alphaproteobacteria bacterium]|nr:hypothetical protein [Alphaproteobacteria bacterium]
MSASTIAQHHLAAALEEAKAEGQDPDAVGRAMLAAVITAFLSRRSIADVRAEILAAADNVDPDTDYMFMRP